MSPIAVNRFLSCIKNILMARSRFFPISKSMIPIWMKRCLRKNKIGLKTQLLTNFAPAATMADTTLTIAVKIDQATIAAKTRPSEAAFKTEPSAMNILTTELWKKRMSSLKNGTMR